MSNNLFSPQLKGTAANSSVYPQLKTVESLGVHVPSVSLDTAIAGERNTDSATLGYLVVRNEANLSVISKTTAVTIGSGAVGDTHLIGLVVTAALTGTCVITGFADSDGTAQSITLPVATPAGFKDFRGAVNSAGALTVTCSTAGDDNFVSVLWRPV